MSPGRPGPAGGFSRATEDAEAYCLDVRGLSVTYPGGARAVRAVDLRVPPEATVALVGESGCGKSTIADAVIGLLPRRTTLGGQILLDAAAPAGTGPEDLLTLTPRRRRALRGTAIGYVTQDPFAAFDPVRSVGHHVAAAWRVHRRRPGRGEVLGRLARLGIEDPGARAGMRPHQWSGGMLQRASIAAAGALGPALVVADEPTSALDAELALTTLAALRADVRAMLLITHNLPLAAQVSDTMYVLYAGRVVEHGPAERVCTEPVHPYTKALVAATPRGRSLPDPLPGSPPTPYEDPAGCAFASRCPVVLDRCRLERPRLVEGTACHRGAQ